MDELPENLKPVVEFFEHNPLAYAIYKSGYTFSEFFEAIEQEFREKGRNSDLFRTLWKKKTAIWGRDKTLHDVLAEESGLHYLFLKGLESANTLEGSTHWTDELVKKRDMLDVTGSLLLENYGNYNWLEYDNLLEGFGRKAVVLYPIASAIGWLNRIARDMGLPKAMTLLNLPFTRAKYGCGRLELQLGYALPYLKETANEADQCIEYIKQNAKDPDLAVIDTYMQTRGKRVIAGKWIDVFDSMREQQEQKHSEESHYRLMDISRLVSTSALPEQERYTTSSGK